MFKSLSGITTYTMSKHPDIASNDPEGLMLKVEFKVMGITYM